jgi:DNA gyrase/topoisomerase IV subunit A
MSRFRSIQLATDCLIPVERRLLLSLHKVAKPKAKRVKSAKVVGYCLGSYHPHGDLSTYGSLVKLANRGLADPKGNFGCDRGTELIPYAGQRYTEIRAKKSINELISENLKFVPWDYLEGMDDPEPIYFSTIVPLGLVGDGFHFGITFYSSTVPRYSYIDLCRRLKHLLDGGDPKNNIIKPSVLNCAISESGINDYYNILRSGRGSLIIKPATKIGKKTIDVLGKAPGGGFTSLIKNAFRPSDKKKTTKSGKTTGVEKGNPTGEYHLIDISKSSHTRVVIEPRRGVKITNLHSKIQKYVTKTISVLANFVDHNAGKVSCYGIDDILLNNYKIYVQTCSLRYQDKLKKLLDRKFEYDVIAQVIRPIFKKYRCHAVSDIINHYRKSPITNISEEDVISICSKKSIKQLIEHKLDTVAIVKQIQDVQNDISNINNITYSELANILKNNIQIL